MEEKNLVNFEDVLKFYSINKINQQKNALDYARAKSIREKSLFGARKISKMIGVPEGTVNNWLMGKKIPRAVKGLKMLEVMGLLPLKISDSPAFRHFLITLGLRYSDGCIYEQKRNNSFTFYVCFSDEIDAKKFIEDSKKAWGINFNAEYSPKARAYYVYLPSSLARLMLAVGSVKGDKTSQNFEMPKWVLDLPDSLKSEFLSGLFSGDGDSPRLKPSKKASESLRLSLSSEKGIANEFCNGFMRDVQKLITDLDIKSTTPKVMENQQTLSKNGKVTYPIVIRILTNKPNMTKFLEKIKYIYCNRAIEKSNIVLEALKECN